MENKYPFQKEWKRFRLKTALGVIFGLIVIAAFYFSLKFFNNLTPYVAKEIILGFFSVSIISVLVFMFHTRYWRCPQCGYKPSFPNFGKYYENICMKCGLNKYEGSTYFDSKIKIRIENL